MAEETPKLSLTQVLHRILDMLALHPDTAKNAHALVDENLASSEEVAQRTRNPFADRPDAEVIEAAVGGDQDAAAEYRSRKAAQATAAAAPPPAPPSTTSPPAPGA